VDVRFVPPDLRRLDSLKTEALCIPFFEDERPLGGALGLVDWRMCGLLSRLIERGRVTGARGETVLVPARPKLTFEKLLLFGLGRKDELDDVRLAEAIERMLGTLVRARVRVSVVVLPGRALGVVAPTRAMEVFLRAAADAEELDAVTLVEDADSQRAMEPVVERERRRARASA